MLVHKGIREIISIVEERIEDMSIEDRKSFIFYIVDSIQEEIDNIERSSILINFLSEADEESVINGDIFNSDVNIEIVNRQLFYLCCELTYLYGRVIDNVKGKVWYKKGYKGVPKNFWYIYLYDNDNTIYVVGFKLGKELSMDINDSIVVVDEIQYWI